MPVTVSYPGVYVEEIPSGVRTVVGVPTSITAFVGRARRGPVNEPVRVQDFGSFERTFGGLWERSALGYAVQHFFRNGGSDAVIVRAVRPDAATATTAGGPQPAIGGAADANTGLVLAAASPGDWGNRLRVRVEHPRADLVARQPELANLFYLRVKDTATDQQETFRNLSTDPTHARFVTRVLEQESQLLRAQAVTIAPADRPKAHVAPSPAAADPFADGQVGTYTPFLNGKDGGNLTDADVVGVEDQKTGLYALAKADLFNLLVIPPLAREPLTEVAPATWNAALAYCKSRRAMLLVDAPAAWTDPRAAVTGFAGFGVAPDPNAAIFYPRVRLPDPLKENRLEEFAPSGSVAGVYARTDQQRGVWKAPAGRDATLFGVQELSVKLTDPENGLLNPLGVNCLRTFPLAGSVVWGARTLRGADELVSEWKYVPVRRLALFLEETLYRNTQWVVFEPNDEPLWAQIRLNIGAFMQDLFRKGAFQGSSPREAYLVKCDKETTTQYDIDRGVVNVVVGFAPLKPAEFVIIKIRQLAGTAEA